jgi:hypothetical protein
MNSSRQPAAFSKVSVRSRTVIPYEVKAGDALRYRVAGGGVLLDKVAEAGNGSFAVFSE